MIRKILTALDGSKTSESILGHVGPLLAKFGAEATLVMVVSENSPRWERYARAYLEGLAEGLRAGGGRAEAVVLFGTPAPAITTFAAEGGYDLLALCARGRSGLRRILLGSVAEAILRQAQVPVLVAHPPSNEMPIVPQSGRILVPLDGSHRSASILPSMSEFARAYGAKVTFVTVVSPTRKEVLPVDTLCHNLFLEQRLLKTQGLEVDLAVLHGDPATEILAYAAKHQADLIALSTHGRTGMDRWRHGSVTEAILRKSRGRMLVFRTAAVVREHPVHASGARARRHALASLADAGGQRMGPYNR